MIETEVKYKYLKADRFVYFNEDDDVLKTIKVRLPEPPEDLTTIDNYGLPPEEQIIKRQVYPRRLKALEKGCESIDDVWKKLNIYKDEYVEEWKWIAEQWERRIHGYWTYINGKPTYIDGWHYTYFNFWKLDVGLPEYRSRDRKFFLFGRYCYTTTEAWFPIRIIEKKTGKVVQFFSSRDEAKKFKHGSKNKNLIIQDPSSGFFINIKSRTCYGFNYPKHRREGATYKANEVNFMETTLGLQVIGGIQSMDESSGKKAFEKAIVKPWRKLPFFFQPRYDGSTSPKAQMIFDVPSKRIGGTGSVANIDIGLESYINFATTASRQFYDGDKLRFLNNDEIGKCLLEDVNARWGVQKKCLAQGNGRFIHGLAINTSTVGEMDEKGGAAFKRLCDLSMWENRNKLGQTSSGLFNLFIPAYDGLEGFIDIFGESIIENPTKEDLWRIPNPTENVDGQLVGAREYLESVRNDLLLRSDEESMYEYEEEIRLHPLKFSECFIVAGSGSGLDLKIITKRIKELEFDYGATQRGNFYWENGVIDSVVKWEPDDINGRWYISLFLDPRKTNRKFRVDIEDQDGNDKSVWVPEEFWRFTAHADPYKFKKTEGKRLSKGGGGVFYERDIIIDPPHTSYNEWQTYRNVCTYLNRPFDPDDYAEDMLMMCIYFGAMMFPEINIPLVWDHFVRRSYDGYLKYTIDPNGKKKATPGVNTMAAVGQKIMQLHQQYIKNHGFREQHIDILLQAKAIKGVEQLTDYDLFTSVGVGYIGSETDYSKFKEDEESKNSNKGFTAQDYF